MTCRVCANTEGNQEYQVKEMQLGLKHPFTYFECAKCKCLQIAEIPDNLAEYYGNDYYSFNVTPDQKFRGLKGKMKKSKVARSLQNKRFSLFSSIKQYSLLSDLGLHFSDRILDVGCGTGYYLYLMAEVGFQNVLGVDPYIKEDIKYANGLEVYKKEVFEVEGLWDLIMYHHSFEHLTNPLENLQKVHKLLSKEGVCLIRIPTVSSFAWKHYGVHWYQLDAPRHIFLHSIESMQILAKQAGFEISNIVYDSENTQFIISEKYKQGFSLPEKFYKGLSGKIQKKIDKYKYSQKAKELNKNNQGDQAAFFLKKL